MGVKQMAGTFIWMLGARRANVPSQPLPPLGGVTVGRQTAPIDRDPALSSELWSHAVPLLQVYLEWRGFRHGSGLAYQYFRPLLWLDKGDHLPAVGEFVAQGPIQPLTKSTWTEWNFDRVITGLTGRVWVGLQYMSGNMGYVHGHATQAFTLLDCEVAGRPRRPQFTFTLSCIVILCHCTLEMNRCNACRQRMTGLVEDIEVEDAQ